MMSPRHFQIAVATLLLAATVMTGEPLAGYHTIDFHFPGEVERVIAADIDGDGLLDLICVVGRDLTVYRQRRGAGFALEKHDAGMRFPGESVGWDLGVREDGKGLRVLALVDGQEVCTWQLDGKTATFSPARTVLSGVAGSLPPGHRYLHFVRDINGDGLADLVVPGTGVFHVYLRKSDGTFADPFRIRSEVQMESRLELEGDLNGEIGQSLKVPLMKLRDVNGDGRRDVVSETGDRLSVYLSLPRGDFPVDPTYSLDLASLPNRLDKFDPDDLDYSNLTGVVAWTFQTMLDDLDGDGVEDLLLREGGKVSFFRGTPTGMDLGRPFQILKSGGNITSATLRDEDGDGLKDLWLSRVEAVSVGDVFLWLVTSGSLDFEAFIYRNEGRRFSRRPYRKITITIRFPSILRMIGRADEFKDRLEERDRVPTVRGDVEGKGKRQDLLVLRDGKLQCYFGAAGSVGEEIDPFELMGYRRDRDEYVVDIENAVEAALFRSDTALAGVSGRRPDLEISIDGLVNGSDMIILDLNGDGHEDMLVLEEQDHTGLRGTIVLSTK